MSHGLTLTGTLFMDIVCILMWGQSPLGVFLTKFWPQTGEAASTVKQWQLVMTVIIAEIKRILDEYFSWPFYSQGWNKNSLDNVNWICPSWACLAFPHSKEGNWQGHTSVFVESTILISNSNPLRVAKVMMGLHNLQDLSPLSLYWIYCTFALMGLIPSIIMFVQSVPLQLSQLFLMFGLCSSDRECAWPEIHSLLPWHGTRKLLFFNCAKYEILEIVNYCCYPGLFMEAIKSTIVNIT